MATVKIYLRKHVLSDGTSPLVLKILKDGKPSISHLGINLKHDDWDDKKRRVRKTHPNATQLNNFLLKKLAAANDKAIEATTINESVSSQVLIKKIKPNSGGSFFKHSDVYLKTLKEAGKFNEYTGDKSRINHFKEFLKGRDITFPDVTIALLHRFKHHLATTLTVGKEKRPITERTVINHFVAIRSVYSQAIREGVVENKYYPFGKEGFSIKFPESAKVPLSADDVRNLEDVELKNANHNHARNLWLLSFYFGGMRASDVLRLKWSDFNDDRLHYTMGKNKKPGHLPMDEKVFLILAQYEADKRFADDFVFPELKKIKDFNDVFLVKRVISENISRIDKFLRKAVAPAAKITVKFTMHIARHTFADLAGDSIPLTMLQKIFRHGNVTTTIKYMSGFINKAADDALFAVLDKVKKKTANDNETAEEKLPLDY